jgi:hypothetical protein
VCDIPAWKVVKSRRRVTTLTGAIAHARSEIDESRHLDVSVQG